MDPLLTNYGYVEMSQSRGAIHPVILSGGSGSRLWPLSRKALPKQLLALFGSDTMIQEAVHRLTGNGFAAPLIVANKDHQFAIAEQLRAAGVPDFELILEPAGRNTAPAATVAALRIAEQSKDGLLLIMPSDHVIRNANAFDKAVSIGADVARQGTLVTFGIKPIYPETGYGYIKTGESLNQQNTVFSIERFVEKPNREAANNYFSSPNYLWNSGIFLFSIKHFIAEMERLEPTILDLCNAALSRSQRNDNFIRLYEDAFLACPSQSIDFAVMEHASKSAVVPVDMGWNDVGSWSSLWEISVKGGDGNALIGDVITENTSNSYIRSDGPLVATVGVADLIVVATKDAVLVSHRGAAQDVKKVVERLTVQKREQVIDHLLVSRPWGSYERIDTGARFQVKRIIVKPGAKLSLQMHHHRAEHWTVVSGTALVTRDDQTFLLEEGASTYIPLGAKHRLENPGKLPLHLIEVQCGSYLGEDDIVRFEDSYGRVSG